MDFRFKYRRVPTAPHEVLQEDKREDEVERRAKGLAYGLSIPFTLAGGPISGWLLGAWLDRLAGTQESHVWTIVLILLGTAAGLKMTVDMLSRLNQS